MAVAKGVFTLGGLNKLWLTSARLLSESYSDCCSHWRKFLYCAQAAIHHEMFVSDSGLISLSHQLRSFCFGGWLGSGWFATACSDNECSCCGSKQYIYLFKPMAWLAVAFRLPICTLSCLGSQQRFGWTGSPLHHLLWKTNGVLKYSTYA